MTAVVVTGEEGGRGRREGEEGGGGKGREEGGGGGSGKDVKRTVICCHPTSNT